MELYTFYAIFFILSGTVNAEWPNLNAETEIHRKQEPLQRPSISYHESLYYHAPQDTSRFGSRHEVPHSEHLESYHNLPHHRFPHFRPSHESPHFKNRHEFPHFANYDHPSHFGYHHEPYYSRHNFESPPCEHGHEFHHFGPSFKPPSPSYGPPPRQHPPWGRPDQEVDYSDYDRSSGNFNENGGSSSYWTLLHFTTYSPTATQLPPQWIPTETPQKNPITPYTSGVSTNLDSSTTLSTVPTATKSSTNADVYTTATSESVERTTLESSLSISSPSVPQCLKSCGIIMTSEYNPVCGTNNVTYQNSRQLSCAKECGVDVQVKFTSACPNGNTTPVTTTSATPTSTISSLTICLRSCSVTAEYNPVCGTNNVTYTNLGKFECAKTCGVDVELYKKSVCTGNNQNANIDSGNTKNITTTFPSMPMNGKEVSSPENPITPTVLKLEDLIDAIFGTTTPNTPTTEFEDYSIDPRFNNILS